MRFRGGLLVLAALVVAACSNATTPLTWSRVPHDEAVFGGEGPQTMWSVYAGVVAVGSDGGAAVWTSSATRPNWSRVPHDEAVFGGEGAQSMLSVTFTDPSMEPIVVAVGWESSDDAFDAAVWTSPFGKVWSRVSHDEAVFGGEGSQTMWSVIRGGPGLVAVGTDGPGGTVEPDGDDDAAVWTSSDALAWSRVPHDEAVFGGEGFQRMSSVTAGGPGLVAVGSDRRGGDDDAAVWTSPDGLTWSRVPHGEAIFGGEGSQSMSSITRRSWALSSGLVAVGSDAGNAAVWTSPDGLSWSRVLHDEAVFGGEGSQAMTSVTIGPKAGPGLVAVGFDGSRDALDAAVWTSPSGTTWVRTPHDEEIFGGEGSQLMWDVTAGGPGLVAVGWEESGDISDAVVWVGATADSSG